MPGLHGAAAAPAGLQGGPALQGPLARIKGRAPLFSTVRDTQLLPLSPAVKQARARCLPQWPASEPISAGRGPQAGTAPAASCDHYRLRLVNRRSGMRGGSAFESRFLLTRRSHIAFAASCTNVRHSDDLMLHSPRRPDDHANLALMAVQNVPLEGGTPRLTVGTEMTSIPSDSPTGIGDVILEKTTLRPPRSGGKGNEGEVATLDSAVLCIDMPMSTVHWSSSVTVEGDDWASILQKVSNTRTNTVRWFLLSIFFQTCLHVQECKGGEERDILERTLPTMLWSGLLSLSGIKLPTSSHEYTKLQYIVYTQSLRCALLQELMQFRLYIHVDSAVLWYGLLSLSGIKLPTSSHEYTKLQYIVYTQSLRCALLQELMQFRLYIHVDSAVLWSGLLSLSGIKLPTSSHEYTKLQYIVYTQSLRCALLQELMQFRLYIHVDSAVLWSGLLSLSGIKLPTSSHEYTKLQYIVYTQSLRCALLQELMQFRLYIHVDSAVLWSGLLSLSGIKLPTSSHEYTKLQYIRLARSPPTKANQAQYPAGSPHFRKWESCRTMPLVGGFSRGSPVFPGPSFRRRYIFTLITLIGSQDLTVKSRPNLFTLFVCENCNVSVVFVA
ncbi:hypothetical protein PR048_008437 [Dryococelus australis]|uniref:Uncharacterized protein n=1 Tax=Dryococelus australis TaxID=614101 RepID=A0ABQ9HX43_9NEOP|nr:hypothetical protein PR048_008437 [Dryococelus australis]